jgi:DNA-binding ferritin-like protein (Dps family)
MKSIIEAIKKIRREKAEYKAIRKLLGAMPAAYQFVYKEIERYMFHIGVDEAMMPVLMNIAESFAVAAAAGKTPLSLMGDDAGAFCDNLIAEFHIKTWRDLQRDKLHENIIAYFNDEAALDKR